MALTALVAVFAFLGAWLAFQLLQHSLTPNAVKAILMFSAFKMKSAEGVELDELIQGAGAINAAGALTLASLIDTAAPLGSPWLTGGFNPVSTVAGETLPWSQGIVWGDAVVWGDTININQAAWAQGIVWGDTLLQWGAWSDSSSYLWGSLYSAGTVTSNSDVWATLTFE